MAAPSSVYLKWGSLLTVVVQNTAIYLTAHASRHVGGDKSGAYLGSFAVLLTELLKAVVSVAAAVHESGAGGLWAELRASFRHDCCWVTTFAVPALCYCIHNNLWYVAVANLDPVTIAVTMQLKIVFAAIFARLMLGQKVGLVRAVAILLLMAGLSLLQAVHLGHEFGSSASVPRRTSTPAADLAEKSGLAAMVGVCLLSGFAGVFTERLLKDRDRHSTLWTRNVQMALFSMPFAVLILLADADHVRRRGLWHGFNAWLFATIGLGALGGLAVSFVFRYADNILKAFAVGLSIALNGVISVWLFSVQLSGYSIVGIALVACASILYNAPSLCWCSLEGCLTESEYERLPLVMVSSVPAISKDASQPEHGHSSSHASRAEGAPLCQDCLRAPPPDSREGGPARR